MIANVMIAIMAEMNDASDHSLLWGHSIEFWDRFGIRALIGGAVLGVVALLLTAASAYILYRVADVAQKDLEGKTNSSSERIAELSAQSEKLRKETADAQLALEHFKSPRILDSNPNSTIVRSLKNFAGTRVDVIADLTASSDAHSFGQNLSWAFQNAGWKVKMWDTIGAFPPMPDVAVGVISWNGERSQVPSHQGWRLAGEKIIALLNAAGNGIKASHGMPFGAESRHDETAVGRLINGPDWDQNDIAPIRVIVGAKP